MAIRSQADQRQFTTFTDQHGREWGADVENKTLAWVGEPQPMGWSAPILPPSNYLHPVPKKAGRLAIDYDAWIRAISENNQRYDMELRQWASRIPGVDAVKALKSPPPELLAVMDTRKIPVEPVVAMAQGNKYALGLTDVVDLRVKVYVDAWIDIHRPRVIASADDMAERFGMDFSEPAAPAGR